MHDVALREAFLQLEEALLFAVSQDHLSLFRDRFCYLQHRLAQAHDSGSLSISTAEAAVKVASRIAVMAQSLYELEGASSAIKSQSYEETQAILAPVSRDALKLADARLPPKRRSSTARAMSRKTVKPDLRPHRKPCSTSDDAAADQLNSGLLRDWFLEHLADPFPDRKEKIELVERINASASCTSTSSASSPITYQQVVLWYINCRRRSGWTTFFRRFADSDKLRMVRIVDALENGSEAIDEALGLKDGSVREAGITVDGCREEFEKVKDWLSMGARERVGDWMKEVVGQPVVNSEPVRRTARTVSGNSFNSVDIFDSIDSEQPHRFCESSGTFCSTSCEPSDSDSSSMCGTPSRPAPWSARLGTMNKGQEQHPRIVYTVDVNHSDFHRSEPFHQQSHPPSFATTVAPLALLPSFSELSRSDWTPPPPPSMPYVTVDQPHEPPQQSRHHIQYLGQPTFGVGAMGREVSTEFESFDPTMFSCDFTVPSQKTPGQEAAPAVSQWVPWTGDGVTA